MSRATNRQQTSIPHLVSGLVFLGLAASWALHEAGVIGTVEARWLLPLVLIVAGAAGLVVTAARGIRGRDEETLVTNDDPSGSD